MDIANKKCLSKHYVLLTTSVASLKIPRTNAVLLLAAIATCPLLCVSSGPEQFPLFFEKHMQPHDILP